MGARFVSVPFSFQAPLSVSRASPTRLRTAIVPAVSLSHVTASALYLPNLILAAPSRRNSTRRKAGLAEIEPDLLEDKTDRWENTSISPEDFVYGEYDGHHTYFEGGEKPSFWKSLKEEYDAAEPPTGFQGLIAWLFLPAMATGLAYHVPKQNSEKQWPYSYPSL